MSAAATTTTTSIRHQLSWQFGVSKKTTHTHTRELTLCEHRQWARPGGHPKAQQAAAAARGIKH